MERFILRKMNSCSGAIFGKTILREKIKRTECRALSDAKVYILSKADLIRILEKKPKIKYYAKRWTAWQLVRQYILEYSRLYYMAVRRGALMNPPLLSNRPNLGDDDLDDIDIAVLDHLQDVGY